MHEMQLCGHDGKRADRIDVADGAIVFEKPRKGRSGVYRGAEAHQLAKRMW